MEYLLTMHFQSRIAGLDGLRGIAILLTLFCHSPQLAEHKWVRPTWAGVNLFFVLSGFLITGILLDSKGQPRYYKKFYARRALRILPIYYLLLFVALFCLPSIIPSLKSLILFSPLYYIFFVQNLAAISLQFPVLGPTWSLAVEEQFYLIWPLLISLMPSKRHILWISVIGLALFPFVRAALYGWIVDPTNFRFLTLFRFDGLLVGSVLAIVIRSQSLNLRLFRWAMCSSAILGIGIFVFSGPFRLDADLRYGFGFLNIGFGGIVGLTILSAFRGEWLSKALSFGPLRYLGQISYGLYLLHKLVFVMCARLPHFKEWNSVAGIAMQFSASIAVAACSWHLFESPVLKLKDRFSYSANSDKAFVAMA
jgi:peptidoglycan/LPS O-acetylase OafA/YrhL